ncbi:glycosyltransferase family 2 protein [Dyadobacter sp. CY261]|uniref:glycosyltransferase family 2 protein n=1 Tax=Dyadobacter sp. CY261 TaxID=2907203 RepID=UPI001F4503F8|nr:glycosyltransferase family 2 protein [Dyadobacter sp. CY261]MCF0071012.1 glycosyltransferase family 2 protein [Dyadobacter sp. CY261]
MISIVVPVYKSAATLQTLHERIGLMAANSDNAYEIVYVNDASPDHSLSILRALTHTIPFHIVDLKKNVGQSAALIAGMAFAQGEIIATMDADLQDEPENLPRLVRALGPGTDVVFAKRQGHYESPGRLATSFFFKGMVHLISKRRIPINAGLFMLVRKDAARQFLGYLNQSPYLIGLISKSGLRCTGIDVERPKNERRETSYTFRKRVRVAISFFRTIRLSHAKTDESAREWLNSHLLADHSYITGKC